MGETRVDLFHLLEDLRDAYPGSVHETILAEIVANALDSGADTVQVEVAPVPGALTIVDNGRGMSRRELERFHDIAASSKAKGEGIGFAGVGVKLGLLEASEVLTETRSNRHRYATAWRLKSRRRAPWEFVAPQGLVGEGGTAVRLSIPNGLSPLLDEGFVEECLQRQFLPLLDPVFTSVLSRHYPRGVSLWVNGRRLLRPPQIVRGQVAEITIRLPRARRPSGTGFLIRSEQPVPEAERGVAVSTFGKVVQRGWDWLGLSPAAPDLITGLIEIPELAECLQTNKAGFIREGPRGARYLQYREAIQRVVGDQLSEWGVDRGGQEGPGRRNVRPFERDLIRVISGLANAFPLLTPLSNARIGGQYKLPEGKPGDSDGKDGLPPIAGKPEVEPPSDSQPRDATPEAPVPERPAGTVDQRMIPGRKRTRGRLQVQIEVEERPDSPDLARLANAVVWVNSAHPAYRRAQASRSTGYHMAVACCLALAPLAAPNEERTFISTFLARWGEVGQ